MKRLWGNTGGLKSNQLRRLEKLYQRRIPPEFVITPQVADEIAGISQEIRRQIGLLITRQGKIVYVIVGDGQQIVIPDLSEYRVMPGRLKGVRCIHTHLKNEPLTPDDLTDLALLRLDLMGAITLDPAGGSERLHLAHILPKSDDKQSYRILDPLAPRSFKLGCASLIRALEDELANVRALYQADTGKERALLVSVSTAPKKQAKDSLAELKDLAKSGGIQVVGTILQQRGKPDPRFLMGRGKLEDLSIVALQKGASLIILDQELNPSQLRSITDKLEMKIIDRTQLILDIFAQRAKTREGKLQVELAQLKYMLPRLVTKNTAMSRLTGGIGGRGPGETKLEINRRRVRDRINRLGKSIQGVKKQRKQQRSLRDKRGLPVISIVGYTNAGKSTLLNSLTQSQVFAENRLFATLDPSSRKLRFPRDTEAIITDTVGFLRDLPKELMAAFRATLEELAGADLLLHVVDISNPRFPEQIASVEKILAELELDHIPAIRVLNKMDRVSQAQQAEYQRRFAGVLVSARDRSTLSPLTGLMETRISGLDADSLPFQRIG